MHALLDGVADDEAVHHRRPLLADPVHATDRLQSKQDQNGALVLKPTLSIDEIPRT